MFCNVGPCDRSRICTRQNCIRATQAPASVEIHLGSLPPRTSMQVHLPVCTARLQSTSPSESKQTSEPLLRCSDCQAILYSDGFAMPSACGLATNLLVCPRVYAKHSIAMPTRALGLAFKHLLWQSSLICFACQREWAPCRCHVRHGTHFFHISLPKHISPPHIGNRRSHGTFLVHRRKI